MNDSHWLCTVLLDFQYELYVVPCFLVEAQVLPASETDYRPSLQNRSREMLAAESAKLPHDRPLFLASTTLYADTASKVRPFESALASSQDLVGGR